MFQKLLSKLTKFSLYFLLFSLPLCFAPFTFDGYEFNKQYLLFFLISIATFSYLLRMIVYEKRIKFKSSFFDIFVLIFFLIGIFSAIFSVDKISSIFGFYGRFSDGLIGFISLIVLYFLITNLAKPKNTETQKSSITDQGPQLNSNTILRVLLWSGFFVVLISFLALFGILGKFGEVLHLPLIMRRVIFNPVSPSLQGLAMFLSVILVILVAKILETQRTKSKISLISKWIYLIGLTCFLIIVDFTPSWILILLSFGGLVGVSLWSRVFRVEVNKLLLPICLIIISLFCLISSPPKVIFGSSSVLGTLPQEEILNYSTSWYIGVKSAFSSLKNFFFGSGLGTFYYDFSKFKPESFNKTWLWQIRFDRPGSHWAEILATMGGLGFLSYFVLISMFILISLALIGVIKKQNSSAPLTEKEREEKKRLVLFLSVFFALIICHFVYYQTLSIGVLFWTILATGVVLWQKPQKEKVISFENFPELSLVFSTGVMLLGIFIGGIWFYGIKCYIADMSYFKAIISPQKEKITKLEKAVRLNPRLSAYRVSLSQVYLNELIKELQKPQKERDNSSLQRYVALAVAEGKTATQLQENIVGNWENLGLIYKNIVGLAEGAIEWGIKSFKKASELDPQNPVLLTEIGKLYLLKNDLQKAKEYFEKAHKKKQDYVPCLLQKALVLEKEDNLDGAIELLEDLKSKYPFNIDVMFQLGRMYFNKGEVEKAITQFKNVISLVPNHANAHYSLGIAFAKKGEKEKAIEEFEKVLELNPGNEDVKEKIKKLKEEGTLTNEKEATSKKKVEEKE